MHTTHFSGCFVRLWEYDHSPQIIINLKNIFFFAGRATRALGVGMSNVYTMSVVYIIDS